MDKPLKKFQKISPFYFQNSQSIIHTSLGRIEHSRVRSSPTIFLYARESLEQIGGEMDKNGLAPVRREFLISGRMKYKMYRLGILN